MILLRFLLASWIKSGNNQRRSLGQDKKKKVKKKKEKKKAELSILANFWNEVGEISQDQAITPLLELIRYVPLGNALCVAHKPASLLYTECLQSHKMLFFCFILLV